MGCNLVNVECRRADIPLNVSSGRVNRLSVNIATQRADTPILVLSSVVCEIKIYEYALLRVRNGGVFRVKNGGALRING